MFDCFQKIFHIFYKFSYELYMHFLCTFYALLQKVYALFMQVHKKFTNKPSQKSRKCMKMSKKFNQQHCTYLSKTSSSCICLLEKIRQVTQLLWHTLKPQVIKVTCKGLTFPQVIIPPPLPPLYHHPYAIPMPLVYYSCFSPSQPSW